MADETEAQRKRKQRIFKSVMIGLMVGSAVFLAERYLLRIDPDTSVIVATFFAVATGMFLLQRVDSA